MSIDVPPMPSQKRLDLDDALEMNEDNNELVMKIDFNSMHDMVMSEGYVYETRKTMMSKIMMLT